MPIACQGSMEPWTNTTLSTLMSVPPYSIFVAWQQNCCSKICDRSKFYLYCILQQIQRKLWSKYVGAHVLEQRHGDDVAPGPVREVGGLLPAKLGAGLVGPLTASTSGLGVPAGLLERGHLGLVGVVQAPLLGHHQAEVIDGGQTVNLRPTPDIGHQVTHGVNRDIHPLITFNKIFYSQYLMKMFCVPSKALLSLLY